MELGSLQSLLLPCDTRGSLHKEVTGLAYHSKTVQQGQLFFCLRGNQCDGHMFAEEAVRKGAVGLVVERFLPLPVPQIRVRDCRAALSTIGRHWYGDPASQLSLIGVTGTNGKTTTTYYIRSVLRQMGVTVGLIGTVCNQFGGAPEASTLTTPESVDLWRLLAKAVKEGCDWVVMEVSSHALALKRVQPADFDIAVITNITRDHFEFHGDFEHYRRSKVRLIRDMALAHSAERPKTAVLNADDPWTAQAADGMEIRVVRFSVSNQEAEVRASDIKTDATGSYFALHLPGASAVPVRLNMPGRFNIANALAAAAVGWVRGVSAANIAQGLYACSHVPGRAEIIDEGQDFQVIVDFAHNPDALAKILTLHPPHGRTILVFGAEGGRDAGKRPLMGMAARAADYVIVTCDNMYHEEPAEVAKQVVAGLGDRKHEVILNRRLAIERALDLARKGDLVILAGKGHEQFWFFGGQRIPFDDRAVAREILQRRAITFRM